jgi:hypothetical protein
VSPVGASRGRSPRAGALLSGVPLRVVVAEAMTELRRDPLGMLTEEDDVEIHALAARGWSVSAISRHTGRDRKTARKYLEAPPRAAEAVAPSCLEPYRGYITARFVIGVPLFDDLRTSRAVEWLSLSA